MFDATVYYGGVGRSDRSDRDSQFKASQHQMDGYSTAQDIDAAISNVTRDRREEVGSFVVRMIQSIYPTFQVVA